MNIILLILVITLIHQPMIAFKWYSCKCKEFKEYGMSPRKFLLFLAAFSWASLSLAHVFVLMTLMDYHYASLRPITGELPQDNKTLVCRGQ